MPESKSERVGFRRMFKTTYRGSDESVGRVGDTGVIPHVDAFRTDGGGDDGPSGRGRLKNAGSGPGSHAEGQENEAGVPNREVHRRDAANQRHQVAVWSPEVIREPGGRIPSHDLDAGAGDGALISVCCGLQAIKKGSTNTATPSRAARDEASFIGTVLLPVIDCSLPDHRGWFDQQVLG